MRTYPCGCIAVDDAVQLCYLHAAAPDLYKALKNLVINANFLATRQNERRLGRARTALKKAGKK